MKKAKTPKTPKVLFPVYIDVEQHEYISRKAEDTGRPKAAIVREWIEKCQREEEEKQE